MRLAGLARGVAWSFRAGRLVTKQLDETPLHAVAVLPAPPDAPLFAVRIGLRISGSRCLARAFVRQAWWAARGGSKEVRIGFWKPAPDRYEAHAWLEGDSEDEAGWEVLWRHRSV